MSKATLEFDLPDEEQQLQMAIDGHKWKMAIGDVDKVLRDI